MLPKAKIEYGFAGDDFIQNTETALFGGVPVGTITHGMTGHEYGVELFKPFRKYGLADVLKVPTLEHAQRHIERIVEMWLQANTED